MPDYDDCIAPLAGPASSSDSDELDEPEELDSELDSASGSVSSSGGLPRTFGAAGFGAWAAGAGAVAG